MHTLLIICEDCIRLSGCSEVSLTEDKQVHVQTCSESPIRIRKFSLDTFSSGLVIPIILLYCCRIKWRHQYPKIPSSVTYINIKLKESWWWSTQLSLGLLPQWILHFETCIQFCRQTTRATVYLKLKTSYSVTIL